MDVLIKILLVLLFPLLFLGRLLDVILGRDPLRLRKPSSETFWIQRATHPDRASYFSETSVAEGAHHGGFGVLARRPLSWLAKLCGPRRAAPDEKFSAGADREQGIPDEVYTLW
ncbi:MAG TPA: hypothetical protein VNT99_19570 [Methylomirabilota bacterium]|nr:hypothetical protein [Methylomirabilota bacterium]